MSGRWDVTCPKCGAERNRTCRTAAGRATDTHVARMDAWADRIGEIEDSEIDAVYLCACGYESDSFACKIRHVSLQTGWARKDH